MDRLEQVYLKALLLRQGRAVADHVELDLLAKDLYVFEVARFHQAAVSAGVGHSLKRFKHC